MNKILLIIDPQNDFCSEGGSLTNKNCIECAKKIAQYIKDHATEYNYICTTYDTHNEHYLETLEGKHLPIKHCIKNTWGWYENEYIADAKQWVEENHNLEYFKSNFGMNLYEPLLNFMFNEQQTQIDICGFCTDICVVSNALILKSQFQGEINCLSTLCAGTTPENHEAALKVMKSCQINII